MRNQLQWGWCRMVLLTISAGICRAQMSPVVTERGKLATDGNKASSFTMKRVYDAVNSDTGRSLTVQDGQGRTVRSSH